jgi:phospholipase C
VSRAEQAPRQAAAVLVALVALVVASPFTAGVAAATPGAAAGTGGHGSHAPRTPIHHFVVLLQENHTFDNYFGTYPGADGIPAGTCMPADGIRGDTPCVRPYLIGHRAITDLDHSSFAARLDLSDGRMTGFVLAQTLRSANGPQAMGYYNGSDLPFYWNLADRYVLFDHLFSSALGGSYANHVYWVAAGMGQAINYRPSHKGAKVTDSVPPHGLRITTIFDRLQQAGVSWKFYVQNYDPTITYKTLRHLTNANRASQAVWVPLLDIPRFLKSPVLMSHVVDLSQYYRDVRDGTLPDVAYIVPSGASEHPPGSIETGQRFVRGLVNALMGSSEWSSSAFMMAYDDWGGWYDHVLPPHRDANGDGFRVPAMLVSPYARQHAIIHTVLDFTSMLKFIEDNWNIRPLTRLDATAGSLVSAFDFQEEPRPPEIIPVVRVVAGRPVGSSRDPLLYGLYGAGVSFAFVAMVLAGRPARRWPYRGVRMAARRKGASA